jgi:hypothetical protein
MIALVNVYRETGDDFDDLRIRPVDTVAVRSDD